MTGTTVCQYLIQDELGAGGMGVVYKAHDTKLGRTVALKFLSPYLQADDTARTRILHEARAAAALDHPNVGTVHEIGETEDGRLFIAMAYYAGETLDAKIKRGPLPVDEALTYAAQIAEGLARAHEAGIIHRDLKPANVIVTSRGRVKIVDFGIAKMAGLDLTQTGSTLGTVGYMSPEQATGRAVDARSDVWSLGVMLYEMLAGRRPFGGEFAQAVIYSVLNVEPPPLRSMRTEAPESVARVVETMLRKDPAARYDGAEEVAVALDACRSGSAGEAVDTGATKEDSSSEPTLAVLPLTSLARTPGQEDYLADGITMELITTLTQIDGLTTRAARSVMRFKGSDASISEIAAQLQVAYVLDGSLLMLGDRLRVSLQLVEGATEAPVWSRTFDGTLEDAWSVLAEITRAVTEEMAVRLTPREEARLREAHPVDPEAYRLYLQGLAFRDVDNPQAWIESVDCYEASIAIDDTFAPPYGGLAMSLGLIRMSTRLLPFEETSARIREALARGFDLDPDNAQAYIARGFSGWLFEHSSAEIDRDFRRAIELDPGNSRAYYQYGWFLTLSRRFEEAHAAMAKGLELDPLAAVSYFGRAQPYFYSGDYPRAIQHCRTALALEKDILVAYWTLGSALAWNGDYDEAIEAYSTVSEWSFTYGNLAMPYVRSGRREEARGVIDELQGRWERGELDASYGVALAYAGFENYAEALRWIEISHEHGVGSPYFANAEPLFTPLRGEPRFQAIMRRMGYDAADSG